MAFTNEHDEQLTGDVLTTLVINFEWRRFISNALQSYADVILAQIDDALVDDFRNQFQALLDDFYSPDDMTPVGTIVAFPSTSPPSAKWLYCDGQLLAQSAYPELYALIGNFYTVPPDANNFRIPNLKFKFIRGSGDALTVPGTGIGADTHQLSIAELPAHTHTIAHTHTVSASDNSGVQARTGRGTNTNVGTIGTSDSSNPNSGSVGANTPHNTIPASMHMAYMIKALP